MQVRVRGQREKEERSHYTLCGHQSRPALLISSFPYPPLEPFDIMSPSLSSAGVVSQAASTISTPRRLLLLLFIIIV
jgi:hypothetical protein